MSHYSKPEISVIMAAYNSAEFIEEAITSILKQTFSNFELIIIDDPSVDRTRSIIEGHAARDKRIVVCSQKIKTGPAQARNIGIGLARGNSIAVLDSDDVAVPDRLEVQLEFVESNPHTVLLGSACILIDSQGIPSKEYQYPGHHSQIVDRLVTFRSIFPHSSCFLKKTTLQTVGGYNPRYLGFEDYDLWLRLMTEGQFTCLSKPLIFLRQHEASMNYNDHKFGRLVLRPAAAVCHFLRSRKVADPSGLDEDDWFKFINWLQMRLAQQNYFDEVRFYYELRKTWSAGKTQPLGRWGFGFTKQVLAHPEYCIKLAWQRFFGSMFPAQLAYEWVQLTAAGRHDVVGGRG